MNIIFLFKKFKKKRFLQAIKILKKILSQRFAG